MTVSQALLEARRRLAGHSDAPDLDAERLLLHLLGKKDTSWLIQESKSHLKQETVTAFLGAVERRIAGEPLAYILGAQEFFGREFMVNSDVLIPRPETESLVNAVIGAVLDMYSKRGKPLKIADIGTGSGCVAVTLLLEVRKADKSAIDIIIATDICEKALRVARQNAARYGVLNDIEFRQGDVLEPLRGELVDLIVSNPPYVPSHEIIAARTSPDITTKGLNYEPTVALDGGHDGQKFLDELRSCGMLYFAEATGGVVETNYN